MIRSKLGVVSQIGKPSKKKLTFVSGGISWGFCHQKRRKEMFLSAIIIYFMYFPTVSLWEFFKTIQKPFLGFKNLEKLMYFNSHICQ